MLRGMIDGVLAGIMISIGGTVLLSAENSVVSACAFTIALLVICMRGYSLYTGKIGFMARSHTKSDFVGLLTGLLGNVIGTLLCGLSLHDALSDRAARAVLMCETKLSLDLSAVFVRALFCGILMYIAVAIWRENKSVFGILFCVPVFIISGFEHSIADMFYLFIAKMVSTESLVFLAVVLLGNTVGGLLFPLLGTVSGRYSTEK